MTTNTELGAARASLEKLHGPVLCAVSGGLDSMCLLHLLAAQGMTVTAAHFNHQLRGTESDRDEAFVRERCAEHGVPFVCGRGDVRAHAAETGKTIEEAARDLRYAFLEEQKEALGSAVILTAHHADDNAETQLLNLLRGTGARGLSGIPETRDDIFRPFLHVTREELAGYAETHHIKYVEDSTNAEDIAARNLLRHKVLPVLRELNPRAVENMARTAELLKEDDEALCRMAEDLLGRSCRMEGDTVCIRVELCREAERAVVKRAIHKALSDLAGRRRDLTARHVEAVFALLDAAPGKELSLPYGLAVRREERELVLFRTGETPVAVELGIGSPAAFGRWRVTLTKEGPGGELCIPDGAALTVTVWDRDDRMELPGSRGARSLKRLCAERGISPAERDALPVLRVNGLCAAVPGVGIHRAFLSGRDRTVYLNFHLEEKDYEK